MKLANRMSRLGTETAFEVLARAKKLEAEGRDIIHLQIGEPDFDTPPNIVAAGAQALNDGYTHYGPSPGMPDVRARIAKEIEVTRHINVSPENVVVTPGGKPIMFFTMLSLINEGDEVLYPNPGFPIYESMINYVGGVPVPMQLHESKDFSIDVEEIESKITSKTKLMILNSPNNPCGSIIPKEDLEKLAELSLKHDIYVMSDEIYIRFLYEGNHESITQFQGMVDRTIILDGFSKTYAMTGWRIGYGIMPEDLASQMGKLMANSVSCTSSATQIAAIEALDGSQDEPNKMVQEFKRRRDIIVNGLNNINGISCQMPKGAFYVFPNVKDTGMTSRNFADNLLQEAGVACLAGEDFGKYGDGFVRFSFANSAENILEALNRIDTFVQKG
tara:strand:- start:37783 stop:38946 length:1164 start_codon:yes stop_codon:yes gene_type:complete